MDGASRGRVSRDWDASVQTFVWDGHAHGAPLGLGAEGLLGCDVRVSGPGFRSGRRQAPGRPREECGGLLVDRALEEHAASLVDRPFDVDVRIAAPIHGTWASARCFRRRFLVVSRRDWLYRCARAALAPVRLRIEQPDAAQRVIRIDELKHGDLNVDRTVACDGMQMRLFDLYGLLVRYGGLSEREGTCPTT